MVKTFRQKYTEGREKIPCTFWFKLYESNKGNRRIEFASDNISTNRDQRILIETAGIFDLYQEKLLRWESGRYDPDIPTYNQIGEEDVVNALKGKI